MDKPSLRVEYFAGSILFCKQSIKITAPRAGRRDKSPYNSLPLETLHAAHDFTNRHRRKTNGRKNFPFRPFAIGKQTSQRFPFFQAIRGKFCGRSED